MVETARKRGWEYLAVTDHSASHGFGDHVTPEALEARIEEVAALNHTLDDFTVLAGTESNILPDGSLDYPDELLERLDWVIGSVHTSFNMPEDAMTDRVIAALESPWLDALGHPTGRKIETRAPYAIDMTRVIEAAARTGTMIEINAAPDRRDMNEIHARAAAAAGVLVLVDSDAHSARNFDLLRYGIATARRAWLTPEQIANTRSWADFAPLRKRAQVNLTVLPGTLAVCRLPASDRIPSWALELHEGFVSITRTPDELSIVCPQEAVPPDTTVEEGFRALMVPGPDPVRADRRAGADRDAAGRRRHPDLRHRHLRHRLRAGPRGRPRACAGALSGARQRVKSGSPYEPVIGFSRAVRAGHRVLVSGTGPVMPDGGCPETTLDQARRCWEIVLAALAEAGASARDVVRTRTFLTPEADPDGAMTAHGEVFADVRPASTMLVVTALLDARWHVEVEAEAQLDA